MSRYKRITTTEYRIVNLLPGQFTDPVKCVLETRPSEVKTSYEALSYQWGDESLTQRTIHIAHYHPPSPAVPDERIEPSRPFPVASFLIQSLHAVWTLATSHADPIHAVLSLVFAIVIWLRLMPLFDPPDWTRFIIPRSLYMAVMSLTTGYGVVATCKKAFWIIVEANQTKPWLLAYESNRFKPALVSQASSALVFGATQVSPNLELALRHLRFKKQPRTLWIDALCINQRDEDEKKALIQRMDIIYANATAVIIWLGDCHGIGDCPPCQELPESPLYACEHESDISDAFGYIWAVSGWRLLLPPFLRRYDTDQLLERGRQGLITIVKRGWWRRLWVIQEATLGTADVKMQCGQHKCDFEDFQSCQARILGLPADPDLQQSFHFSERFVAVFRSFRYSSFNEIDTKQDLSSVVARGLMVFIRTGIDLIFRDLQKDDDRPVIHKEPPAKRLLLILAKTAGYFECRNDRDRLYAVLGVVGGAKRGRSSVASFVEFISSHQTHMIIGRAMDSYLESLYPNVLARCLSGALLGIWPIFYDSTAKNWTISRPEYVMTKYRAVLQAVEGKASSGNNRSEFFTALAQHLAKTAGLGFLDACSPCADDHDIPSWVPTWTSKVDDAAYEFMGRKLKADQAPDWFEFSDNGRTMKIMGLDYGVVDDVRVVELSEHPLLSLAQIQHDLWTFVPETLKDAFAELSTGMEEMPIHILLPEMPKILAAFSTFSENLPIWAKMLLKAHGNNVVQCGKNGEKTAGFLKAGKAVRGDRIVFVPGCYHQLVLRKASAPDKTLRWKLVGLVLMNAMIDKGRKKVGYSRAEWNRLAMKGALKIYAIV